MPLTYTTTLYLVPNKDGTCSIRCDQDSAVALAAKNLNVAVEHELHLTMPCPPGPQIVKHVAEVFLTEIKPKPPQPEVPAPAVSDGWDYNPPGDYVLTRDDEVDFGCGRGWESIVGLEDWKVLDVRGGCTRVRRKINPQSVNYPTTIQYSPGG